MSGGSAGDNLRVICGPTAAGKSDIAMRLAERFGAVIVCADSRQVYRRFDIGTAKPTVLERARVPHRGVDVADPADRYSAVLWAGMARSALSEARQMGRTPVVVGGTGFYIRALAVPLFESEPLDPERRAALEPVLGKWSTAELRRWCRQLDVSVAHLGRAQLIRALEVALLTGIPMSKMREQSARQPAVRARYLLIDPLQGLAERIAMRIGDMLRAGWLDEVRELDSSVGWDAPAWNATGYAIMREHVRCCVPLDDAIERVAIRTRQYAKRQRTWFRHQLPADVVTKLDPRTPDAYKIAIAWWEAAA